MRLSNATPPFHQSLRTCRSKVIVAAAKDKKGSKKGVSALAGLIKKKIDAEAESQNLKLLQEGERASPSQYAEPEVRGLLFDMINSYYKATKRFLVDGVDLSQLPEAIFLANMCILAHNRFQEGVTDPQFIYANKAALELWDATWNEMIGMPSRLSAAPDQAVQEDRLALLDAAANSKSGFVENYEGWRVGLSGKRFKIKGVTLFNVVDFTGDKIGQAAVFNQYELEDGTVVQVTGDVWQPAEIEVPPSAGDVEAAEVAVEEQAAAVRHLKEALGKTNMDPEVQAAVAELKARKEKMQVLKSKFEEAVAASDAAFDSD
ncbi:hypothetical protein CEUSTIGMA_g2906.t1 [Chlamydomonas eustigma]|uniref:WHEP-TRS domain-containing protein n=1 Tax=Chlamydomonas eustigma TaxID=1157962 RepID=A0A250WX91_9CHLO|nr:hypothetical protein CEUSTIGMA_g2906.t1 [Chlamydomonas eustigma]|eukprot:GAX75463.1 hypothetical protein CEUSTIGMA_g2906.t1 [Chlamydomonas eustigma]